MMSVLRDIAMAIKIAAPIGLLLCVTALVAVPAAPSQSGAAMAETAGTLYLFTAPEENAPSSEMDKHDKVVEALAQSFGSGGTEWYLVRTKTGAVGWIKADATDATKKFNSSFKSLSSEPSVSLTSVPSSRAGRSDAITIPLDTRGSLAVVAVTFNRRLTANLALDTGASKTMISRRIAQQLALHSSGSALVSGIGGTVAASYARIDSISVGQAEVANLLVAVHDFSRSPRYEGLLGLDFLGNFNIAMDTKRQLLVLSPR
jgi:predicted aspartyl protease